MTITDEETVPLFQFHDCDDTRVDPDIAYALEESFEYTIGPGYSFEFQMEEKDFYAVLSVIDAHNAPALIELGMRTPEEVLGFLRRHSLNHLIRNNTVLTETAMRLELPIEAYFDLYGAGHRRGDAYARITKGMEKFAEMGKKRYCRSTLLALMVSDMVNYEDAEQVGYSLIEEYSKIPEVAAGLIRLKAHDDEDYTAADIRRVLTEGTTHLRTEARMKLLLMFGAETAFLINATEEIHQICSYEEMCGRDKISSSLALFMDTIIKETTLLAAESGMTAPLLPPVSTMKRMHSAGVDPVWVSSHLMGDEWDENHIMALHEGITQPLTDGWL